ncbi:MAG TPA: RagB/SusD family nutrient uptake outer membrane protein, partial [Longimicrobiaceae bacterium]|nr:RagB/SusD family nutrient uptake outer membrane protein [Longimicrobiaceae bacterium]
IEPTNGDVLNVFQYLHRARNLSERAIEQYGTTSQNNSADHAMITNLAGFTYVMFAENFCSGVPFSRKELGGEVVFGGALHTRQMLDSAVTRFDAATTRGNAANAAAPTGPTGNPARAAASQQLNLARVGRGRALLARGDFAGAAAAVAAVPDSFVYNVAYSENASGQNNGVWYNINSERRSSVATGEGGNGIVFFRRGPTPNTIDPRAPVDSLGRGIGTSIAQYRQRKYETRGAAIPLATGVEARLIQAEAALNKGQSAAYLPLLNQLRTARGLTSLTDPGNAQGRVRQFFQERAFFLWLTGHRLGDMRRMVREYGFSQAQVFPVGQTIFGSPYGTDVNFPIPVTERNNPEAPSGQCIDRNA